MKDTISRRNGHVVSFPTAEAMSEEVKRALIRLRIYLCRNGHKREEKDGNENAEL